MWPALDKKLSRFHELELQLQDPAIIGDSSRYGTALREHGSLSKLIQPYVSFQKLAKEIDQAQTLLTEVAGDTEMQALAEQELTSLRSSQAELKTAIEDQLLIDPEEDFSSVIMEIRAGTGGDEAALFAGDLYEMYTRYGRIKGWAVEAISFSPGEAGGYKEVTLGIKGDGVYQFLRFESGGHRVQRVPKTETQGRIHTSLATVGILPEPDQVQVDIKESDVEWERMRAGGAGGQKVNKTESAVRIWYKKGTPDEVEVKCQDERSQHKNFDRAMRILRSRVYEHQRSKLHEERAEMRRTLIGGGDRSEKIRTYNFPDNRVTDHRVKGLSVYKLEAILAGELDHLILPLREHDKQERLAHASNG